MATPSGHGPTAAKAQDTTRRARARAEFSGLTEGQDTGRPIAADADRADPIEVWGRRVGRGLGFVAVVLLVINLFTHWFF